MCECHPKIDKLELTWKLEKLEIQHCKVHVATKNELYNTFIFTTTLLFLQELFSFLIYDFISSWSCCYAALNLIFSINLRLA